jgi:hypothetical protein
MRVHGATDALLAIVLCMFAGYSLALAQATQKSPAAYDDLPTLTSRLLKSADAADCHKSNCQLLIANFSLPNGFGSFYGRQLADDFAHELQTAEPSIVVIDRTLLYAYLETERIPSRDSSDRLWRAIAADLHATSVLIGTTTRLDDDTVEISARMLSVADKNHIARNAEVKLNAPKDSVDLTPSEPFAPLPPLTPTAHGDPVYQAGQHGVSLPACNDMPGPPSPENARKFGISAGLKAEAIVTAEGKLVNLRILWGLPAGLNKSTLDTLKTWRCKPALKDGKPVAVATTFELNFR